MIETKGETFILDENINDIFERKIEVGAVIQFNLLQRLIEEFIKRQKVINDKVNNLEIKINAIESMPIDQGILNSNLDESNINFDTQKDFNKNQQSKDNENNKENEKEKQNINKKKNTNKNDNTNNKDNKNKKKKKIRIKM